MLASIRTAAVLLGFLVIGCTAPAQAPSPAGESQPKRGGSTAGATGTEPSNFDITIAGRSGGNSDSVGVAYEPILEFKSGPGVPYHQMTVEPGLAERWEVSTDARSFTFHLRRGVKFANLPPVNGRELTSADVKFSYEYQTRTGEFSKLPAGQFAFYFEGLDRVETPDPYTAVVRFKDPFVPFLSYAAAYHNAIMPREIFDADGHFKDKIVGTGPWQLDESATQKGTRWVWKRNPSYWQEGRPYIDELRWISLPDIPSRLPAFQTKQVDLVSFSALPATELERIKKDVPWAVIAEELGGGGTANVYLNVRKAPLNDVRVRRAILLGLDRDEIIRTLLGRGKWALAGAYDDIYTEAEVKQILRHDPDEARRLVIEAGYPNGVELEWMYPARGYSIDLVPESTLIQSQLKKVGINLKLLPVDFQDWLGRTRVGVSNFELVPRNQAVKEDVDAYAYGTFHSKSTRNYSGVNDPELDRLLEGQRAELNPEKRREILRQAAKLIADRGWGFRTAAGYTYQIWQPYVKNYYPHNGREGWELTDSWLDK